MRSRAVILTYPGHFLLTQLTLRSIQKHFPEVKEIAVIADDCSSLAWPGYIQDCQTAYQQKIIPVSESFVAEIEPGWLRQQMIKMHIDEFVDWQEFFITDGDIRFDDPVPYGVVPVSFIEFGQIDKDQTSYVSMMLGRPHIPLRFDCQDVITSNAAFRDTNRVWWRSMRSFIEAQFQKTLLDLHTELKHIQGVSEWELIESYKRNFLDLKPKIMTFFCNPITEAIQTQQSKFSTCWCTDKQLGYEWWQQQHVDLGLWEILPNSK